MQKIVENMLYTEYNQILHKIKNKTIDFMKLNYKENKWNKITKLHHIKLHKLKLTNKKV